MVEEGLSVLFKLVDDFSKPLKDALGSATTSIKDFKTDVTNVFTAIGVNGINTVISSIEKFKNAGISAFKLVHEGSAFLRGGIVSLLSTLVIFGGASKDQLKLFQETMTAEILKGKNAFSILSSGWTMFTTSFGIGVSQIITGLLTVAVPLLLIAGLFFVLKAAWDTNFLGIVDFMYEFMGILSELASIIWDELLGAFIEIGGEAGEAGFSFRDLIPIVRGVADVIIGFVRHPAFIGFIRVLGLIITGIGMLFSGIGPIIAVFGILLFLFTNFNTISKFLSDIIKTISDYFKKLTSDPLQTLIDTLITINPLFGVLINMMSGVDSIMATLTSGLNMFIEGWQLVFDTVSAVIDVLGKLVTPGGALELATSALGMLGISPTPVATTAAVGGTTSMSATNANTYTFNIASPKEAEEILTTAKELETRQLNKQFEVMA